MTLHYYSVHIVFFRKNETYVEIYGTSIYNVTLSVSVNISIKEW